MITIHDLCDINNIDETVVYDEVADVITDIISRNLNIRYDQINPENEIIKDLGATPLCFINIFMETAKTFELIDGDYFISEIKAINDLIFCIKNNCDLILVKTKQIVSQYLSIPISDVDLDELFEDYAYEYKKNQKDLIRLLIKNLGYEKICLLDCLSHLTLEDVKTIAFEKLPYEQKKNIISSLIKSIGIENLCLLDDISDLTLEEIKEIIHTNKETG